MLKKINAKMSTVMSFPSFMVTDITMALTLEKTAADKGYTALRLQTERRTGRRAGEQWCQKGH